MNRTSCALAAIVAGLALGTSAQALTVPVTSIPVVVPAGNPLAGATLLNSIDSGDVILGSPDLSTPSDPTDTYTSAKVHLVTQVYRTAGGTIAFAYTIDSQSFPAPPNHPLPLWKVDFTRLEVAGLTPYSADVYAAADYGTIAARGVDNLAFSFVSGNLNDQGFTQFHSLTAGQSATVFLLTNAASYQPADVILRIDNYNGAIQTTGGNTAQLRSFGVASAPVPEPLSLLTLPLAVTALALRRHRPRT